MTEREKLIEELCRLADGDKYLEIISVENMADFILADRKRIVKPLNDLLVNDASNMYTAIQETLKNAGV